MPSPSLLISAALLWGVTVSSSIGLASQKVHADTTLRSGESPMAKAGDSIPEFEEITIHDYRKFDYTAGIYIRIRDAETKQPIEADLSLDGVGEEDVVYLGSDFKFDAPRRELIVYVNRAGYFFYHHEFEEGVNDGDTLQVYLSKVAPGKKMSMKDIYFMADSHHIVVTSVPALQRLTDFMLKNPSVRIKVRGHVNAPDRRNTARVKGLSKKRAKTVVKYLKSKGVDADRLKFEGVGNAEMVFENPTFDSQRMANRRVEIVILK